MLRTGLHYRDLRVLLLELGNLVVCDLDLSFFVHLVGEAHDLHIGTCMLLDLIQPDWDAKETLSVCQVKDNNDAVSALVISISERTVSLLSRRVPNL